MSIKNWFNKPKWQSQNEKVRMTAITNSQDPELIKNLLSIVETDTSQAVKKVAIIRMTDFQQLTKIANSNHDKPIRQLAHKKIIQWMSQDKDSSQTHIADQITDSASIEALAKTAVSTEVRKSMIQQIDKQGLLGDLIKTETDPMIKQQLLDKISQASTLQRISEYFKKKDQKLFKQIINKLEAGNETVNYDKTGLELCQQLESVVHKKSSSKNIDLKKISQSWNNIIDHVSLNLIQRYAGAYSAAKMILDPEHRDVFLNKQKQQRLVTQISALAKVCETAENSNLKQLQSHLNLYQNIDLQDATDSQKLQIENHLENLLNIRDK
ncbi:MAG: hypothetical protein L3J52_02710, partial [Proteobacteria bacterium]|nr:hypothetical protein [Pseudomonadota bacterium]